jgi:hypothetical protein
MSSGPSWRRSGSSSRAPASRSTRACGGSSARPPSTAPTRSSTPCWGSRCWPTGVRSGAHGARRAMRRASAASRTPATCARAAIPPPRRSCSRTRSRHRCRPGLRGRRAVPGHLRPGLRRLGISRHRPAAGSGRGDLGQRHQGSAHRRGGDARGAQGDRRDHRGPSGRRPRPRAVDHGLSPDRLLVAARVDLADDLSADEIERASSEIDRELRERIPTVWQVFLDATPRSEAARPAEDRPQATDA